MPFAWSRSGPDARSKGAILSVEPRFDPVARAGYVSLLLEIRTMKKGRSSQQKVQI